MPTGTGKLIIAYENERRPPMSAIVLRNREGPEHVIDAVESRAPHGFDDVEPALSYTDRKAIVSGYARLAGCAVDQVNRR